MTLPIREHTFSFDPDEQDIPSLAELQAERDAAVEILEDAREHGDSITIFTQARYVRDLRARIDHRQDLRN